MKFQVLLLISLACFSAFAQFTSFTATGSAVEIDGVSFEVGLDGDRCGVRRTAADNTEDDVYLSDSGATTGSCTPQGIYQVEDGVWIVLLVDGSDEILIAANGLGGVDTVYTEVFPWANAASITDPILVVAGVSTAEATFGQLTGGSYLGTTDGTNFDGFTVTSVDICKSVIRVEVDTAATFEVVGTDGQPITDATGDGIFLSYDTTNAAVSVSDTLEECEEEEEEENGAGILSVVSALLAVVGVVAL